MFRFVWPWVALFLPLPFVVKWLLPVRKSHKSVPILHFPMLWRLKTAFPRFQGDSVKPNRLNLALLFLFWTSLILAFMRPEKIDTYTYTENQGYDLMLAVDLSASMKALDFSTANRAISRLDAAKTVVGKFVKRRQGDRVGLIAFGENAYLHVPLTYDTQSVSDMLNDTLEGMAGSSTAIGDAIGQAVRTLRKRPEDSRVLILLTDGEDNASSIPPLEAAKLAKQYGIRIYTVGIGTNGPVPFPTAFGGGFRMVEVPMDEELLKEIAHTTGGQYYHAGDQETLEAIYAKIDRLEKTEWEPERFLISDPLYAYPLALAMVCALLLGFIPIRKKVAHGF